MTFNLIDGIRAQMSRTTESKLRLAEVDIHQQWERDYLSPDLDAFYDEAFSRIVEAIGPTTGKTILDIGCGYCFHTVRLARSGLKITAADFSQAALDQAQETIDRHGLADRVTLRQADATNLPFPDSTFDNVLIWGVLMHIPEVEKALAEAARVLKPGGSLILAENNANSLEVRLLEPTINALRAMAGKRDRSRTWGDLGIEEWQMASSGGLLIRKSHVPSLCRYLAKLGLQLDVRFAGQFTELYARLPGRLVKKAVHAFNLLWFRHVRAPGLSLGNILIFKKSG